MSCRRPYEIDMDDMTDSRSEADCMTSFESGRLEQAPAWAGLALAFFIGLAYAFFLFGKDVVLGVAPYWRLPVGISGGDQDMRVMISGYEWFVQSPWTWPILDISRAVGSHKSNAVLYDCIPIVALLGKIWKSLAGSIINPYPFWVTSVFAGNALAMAAFVRMLGQRSWLAMTIAGIFGTLSPEVHMRYGHMALGAQWIVVCALTTYVWFYRNRHLIRHMVLIFAGLCALSVSVHIYFYPMVASIAGAATLQAVFDRRLSLLPALAALIVFVAAGVVPLWVFGALGTSAIYVDASGFGRDSMNVLSPFWPQTSGLFRWTGIYVLSRGIIEGVPGQYEGYSYLGGGVLLLLVVATWRERRSFASAVTKHAVLIAVLIFLTVWALSNRVYLGQFLVASYPVPEFLDRTMFAWFRSSGRFFWPVGWLVVGLAVAFGLRGLRPRYALTIGVLAVVLQAVDVAPWWDRLHGLVRSPVVSTIGSQEDREAIHKAIAAYGRITVLPSAACMGWAADNRRSISAAIEIQLMASRQNAMMPDAFTGRSVPHCSAQENDSIMRIARGGALVVFRAQVPSARVVGVRRMLSCKKIALGFICGP